MESYKGRSSILGLAKGWGERYFAKLKISLLSYHEQFFLNILCDFHSIYQSVLQFPTTVQYPMMDFLTKLPHFSTCGVSPRSCFVALPTAFGSVSVSFLVCFSHFMTDNIKTSRPVWDHCQTVTQGVALLKEYQAACVRSRRWGYRRIVQSVTKQNYT